MKQNNWKHKFHSMTEWEWLSSDKIGMIDTGKIAARLKKTHSSIFDKTKANEYWIVTRAISIQPMRVKRYVLCSYIIGKIIRASSKELINLFLTKQSQWLRIFSFWMVHKDVKKQWPNAIVCIHTCSDLLSNVRITVNLEKKCPLTRFNFWLGIKFSDNLWFSDYFVKTIFQFTT